MWGVLTKAYNYARRGVGMANNIVKRVSGVGHKVINWTDSLLKVPAVGELAAELAETFPEVAAPVVAGYVGAKVGLAAADKATSAVDSALAAFPEARDGT